MPLEALLQALTILPLDSIHSSSVQGNAFYFDSEGVDSVARNCIEIHGLRKRKPPGHCRLLIADCGSRKSKLENRNSAPMGRSGVYSEFRVSSFEFRISAIGKGVARPWLNTM